MNVRRIHTYWDVHTEGEKLYHGPPDAGTGGVRMARSGSIAGGLVLMLIVAPFLWFANIGGPLVSFEVRLGILVLAWVVGVGGFILFIYGMQFPAGLPPSPDLQFKYCSECGTLNHFEARFCNSCRNELSR